MGVYVSHFPIVNTAGMLLEAEVTPAKQAYVEARYAAATGTVISPGNPVHYQHQPNKWGAELRAYFNDAAIAAVLIAAGVPVEHRRSGYKSGKYAYRANDNELWWDLVEAQGARLGPN